jgi:PAS domain S-box-containing protein
LIDIVHPDDKHLFDNFLRKEHEDIDDFKSFDFRIQTKEQTTKWINHVYRKVFDDNGKYLGIRVSNRDITKRKIAEEELRKSEERFRSLFYESPDAVFVQNFDGIVLDVNPAGCKLHRMEKEDIIGKNVMDLVPDFHKDTVAEEFPKWISGEMLTQQGYSITSAGLSVPVQINGSKFLYSGKEALLFIVRDITRMKETEDKLRKSLQKAEEADMLKSVFLANMSHEIRTPMNAIIGFSEILSDQDLSKKERQEFINYITQGSNTLMNLIEDIIDITKIEAGQIKINFEACDVNNLMDELYATFIKMKNKNGKQKLEIRLNKPIVKEGFTITTDPSRIRQILSNLIVNALKFTDDGFIEFGFTITGENQIVFYVKDTGIGIPEDKKKLIFDRFGQVEHHLSQNKKGTGLGLSISKKLSELLGGDLTVESEVDKGSIFFLTLPIVHDYKEEVAAKDIVTESPKYDWSDKTFLIAEDSVLNYTFLEALFQKTNVNLLWAKDGKEAVDLCRENSDIDLVLMDIKMPILSGLEAITEIKKFRKDLPIIVQTAYAMPEDRDKSIAAGGDEHLTKPLNVDELFKTITKFLD